MTLVSVDGRELSLSNLDKVLYPACGFTKGQVISYYQRIAPVLLPHLEGRPLTLKRYPNGVDESFFYEKRCPKHRPEWVRTTPVWSDRNRGVVDFCVVDDLPSLIWVANLASLELHTSLSRTPVERPTMVVFDLDPGPPATIVECTRVGLLLREVLDGIGLQSVVKTSGSKGLQLYIPVNTEIDYESKGGTKRFAHALAQVLEKRHPDLVVSTMNKDIRTGKVFIDWSQNDEHKTTVCVYSLRAREHPTVSTPVTWDEVDAVAGGADPDTIRFEADEVVDRVAEIGDLFAPLNEVEQSLPVLG